MRLAKSVQVAFGFAATSGALVVLSGSALAADSGSATTAQAPLVTIQLTDKQAPQAAKPGAGITKGVVSDVDKRTLDNDESKAVPAKTSAIESSVEPKSDAGAANIKPEGGSSAVLPVEHTTTPSDGMGSEPHVAAPGDEHAASVVGVVAQKVAGASAMVLSPEVIPVTSVVSHPTHSTVLPLQPTITGHMPALAVELAGLVPAVPADDHTPVPAKSSGLLGHITAELAGTVVPQSFSPFADAIARLMAGLDLAVLMLLLANVFTFTYGLWLRRGGFATAARSDAPQVAGSSYFATPRLLGYVPAPPRLHSPIFVVAEIKTSKVIALVPNVYRKEDMR